MNNSPNNLRSRGGLRAFVTCANNSFFTLIAMKTHEITEKLALAKLKDRLWFVQPSVATDAIGLDEGFTWMSDRIKELPKK